MIHLGGFVGLEIYNYISVNTIDIITYDEIRIVDRIDFDLVKEKISFNVDNFMFNVDMNAYNRIVEIFVIEKDVYGNEIKNNTYYIVPGYYVFICPNRLVFFYLDIDLWGYVGTNVGDL